MRPQPTVVPTTVIINPPHHIGMAQEELASDDAVSYTQQENRLQHS